MLPAYRGRGIARRLVEAVERQARSEGIGEVRLSVRLVLSEGAHVGHVSYDAIADDEAAWVDTAVGQPERTLRVAADLLLKLAGPVAGRRVCDLGCVEGHLARRLAEAGAQVVGVDTSERLLALARERTPTPRVRYLLDDAQQLSQIQPGSVDAVVCNFALMDIPDLAVTGCSLTV